MTHRNLLPATVLLRSTAALLLVPALAACGSTAEDDATDAIQLTPADETESHDHGSHDHGDMPGMTGDPDATPAHELPDADLVEGSFALLADAPDDAPEVTGSAWLARTADGTTLSVDLAGLEPGTEYTSHLHAEACEPDAGGDHFRFDPEGSDQPPNEIHLALPAGDDGAVATTISNPNPDSEGAASMVLHLADGTKFACADLAG